MNGLFENIGHKRPPHEVELYRRIDEVVHYMWDPIGVADDPDARDEYYSYLPEVFRLAKQNGSVDLIANYLNQVQTERMGLSSNLPKCAEVAAIIVAWSKRLGCQA